MAVLRDGNGCDVYMDDQLPLLDQLLLEIVGLGGPWEFCAVCELFKLPVLAELLLLLAVLGSR
jgi:hypothetical protein